LTTCRLPLFGCSRITASGCARGLAARRAKDAVRPVPRPTDCISDDTSSGSGAFNARLNEHEVKRWQVDPNTILYPVFAMFFLVAFTLVRLARLRLAAVRTGEMKVSYYRTYHEGDEPEHMRVVTRHFINLFEMPMLFYVGVIMTYIAHQVSLWLVLCAWVYVAIRYAHSFVHMTSNDVLTRFRLYFASNLVLLVMWLSLLLQLLRAE
jgi:hypothetical protein